MKIAILIKSFINTGGSQKYAVEIARRLLARGHVLDIYTREVDKHLTTGMGLYNVPEKLMFSSVLSLYTFSDEVNKLLQQKTYDIIHSHERGFMVQDVSTVHSFSYKSGLASYPFYRKIDQLFLNPRSWLHLWLEGHQINAPRLAAVSEVIKRGIGEFYNRKDRIDVMQPGVDIKWFHPNWVSANRSNMRAKEKIADDELVVLFVGSEFKRKGLDTLIPAIGPGMRLLIAGRGDRLWHYKALIKQSGISSQVCFYGLVDNIRDFYAMADVVVLPSLSDAFGMSILEGMACGLPVVTSKNSGVAAIIENGLNGYIFNNPDQLKDILQSLKDTENRRLVGQKARESAENLTWETTADKYETLFYQIIEEKKNLEMVS